MPDSLRISIIQMGAYDMLSPHHSDNEMFFMLEMEKAFEPDIILLPECAWPGYFLSGWDYSMQEKSDDVRHRLAQMARRLNCFIVAGLPEPDTEQLTAQMLPFNEGWMQPEASPLFNSAIAYNKAGKVVATGRKVNLWHFDGKWFKKGEGPASFRTRWGKVGLMVCADGRMPALVEEQAKDGCRLILNCTNWVTTGPDRTKLTNPQADYLIRVRAMENNVWIASANKVGLEDGLIAFCGGSQLVSPEGQTVVRASSDKIETLRVEIPLDEAGRIALPAPKVERAANAAYYGKAAFEQNDSQDGKEASVAGPKEGTDDRKDALGSLYRSAAHPYVAVVQQSPEAAGQPGTGLTSKAAFKRLAVKLEAIGADIVVFSGTFSALPGPDPLAAGLMDEPSLRSKALIIPYGRCAKCGNPIGGADVYFGGKSLEQYGALNRRDATRGCPKCGNGDSIAQAPVVQTPFGPIGLVLGKEGHEHRLIANLARMGVGMFAWITSGLVQEHDIVTRARSMESRVWFATANPARIVARVEGPEGRSGLSLIVEPDGRVAACAFPDEEQVISSYMDLCLAERADVVPGTKAVR